MRVTIDAPGVHVWTVEHKHYGGNKSTLLLLNEPRNCAALLLDGICHHIVLCSAVQVTIFALECAGLRAYT